MYAKVHEVSEQEVQLRVKLEGIMAERFLALKTRLGFESNTDLVRLLITRAYQQEIGKPGAT
jgi:hypothetical protein